MNQTYDEDLTDPYHYTKILHKGSQLSKILHRDSLFLTKLFYGYLEFMENKKIDLSKYSNLILNHIKSFNLYHYSKDQVVELLENFLEDIRKKGYI